MARFFNKEEKKPFTYSSIEMRKSSNKAIWWILILCILSFVGIVGFLYFRGKITNNCKVSVEDIKFEETKLQDGTPDNKSSRIYRGVIINSGNVNVTLKGIRARLYDKDNEIVEESYLDYKDYNLALTQKIELEMVLSVDKSIQITKYEFLPEYACSATGSYIN